MSYLDEISGGSYYLNAFNNLLKRRQMENAAQNQMVSSGGQMPQMMGEGGGSSNPGWDALSNAEKAAYYSDNPTMAGTTQFGQKALGYAPFGVGLAMKAQELMFPQFVAEQASVARGIDPATGLQVGGYGSQPGPSGITPTGLYGDQFAGQQSTATGFFGGLAGRTEQAPAPVASQTPSLTPAGIEAADIAGGYGNFEGYGAGFGGANTSNSFGEGQYAQGGMVRLKDLLGKAPGPDDGYGALQGGEYVITKAAVERYGKAMMDAINNGTFR